MFTYRIKRHTRVRFNNQLVVDMHDNAAASKRLHGIAQNVTGGCLHDVELYMEHTSDVDQIMEIVEQSYRLQADE